MSSYNKAIITGNITADPEIKETPNGQKVATFSVATSRKWNDASGSIQEETEFHNCVAWRGLAEVIERYVTKGMKVQVDGYLKTRKWDHQSGVKMYRTEIIAQDFLMLSQKKDNDSYPKEEATTPPPRSAYKPKPEEEISIDDIPF